MALTDSGEGSRCSGIDGATDKAGRFDWVEAPGGIVVRDGVDVLDEIAASNGGGDVAPVDTPAGRLDVDLQERPLLLNSVVSTCG